MSKQTQASLNTIFKRLLARNEHLDHVLHSELAAWGIFAQSLDSIARLADAYPPARWAQLEQKIDEQPVIWGSTWDALSRPVLEELESGRRGRVLLRV